MKKLYIAIALLVVILDQATKYLVNNYISPFRTIEILPFLHLVNIRNTGTAFGMFRDWGNGIFIIISLAAIAVIFFMLIKGKEDPLSLSLILGGAIGNLIDRIFRGSVVDFIDVFASGHHWPAFNVADSALTIGIGLIFITLFKPKGSRIKNASGIN
ncbi:MAG: signal peptidase II [Nitrospirae bacterium]|nr:MAG: signal peptidase II [Nitrospirota bacterium]